MSLLRIRGAIRPFPIRFQGLANQRDKFTRNVLIVWEQEKQQSSVLTIVLPSVI
jgi:hypothetical protein